MSGDKVGWFAALDEDQAQVGQMAWQPSLQLEGICLELPIWFKSEMECLEFIDDEIIGKGRWE